MSVEIKVPTLGESIVEATVGKWMKQEGEVVAVGEPALCGVRDALGLVEVGALPGQGVQQDVDPHRDALVVGPDRLLDLTRQVQVVVVEAVIALETAACWSATATSPTPTGC